MVMPLDTSAIDAAKKGSADLLILALIDAEPLHGYEIAGRIDARSDGTLRFTLASLYATLYRLEERDLIRGRWVERAGQRRRKVLTGLPAKDEPRSPPSATTGAASSPPLPRSPDSARPRCHERPGAEYVEQHQLAS